MDGIDYYFRIIDLDMIGKMSDYSYYIYALGKGWEANDDHLLSDRIIGYDFDRIGSSDMMNRVEVITEEEAMKIIEQQ